MICIAATLSAACHDLTGNQPLPVGTVDPSTVANAAGARAMATAARAQFQYGLNTFIVQSGMLSDELQANIRGSHVTSAADIPSDVGVDARQLTAGANLGTDQTYGTLQQIRALTNLAIGALLQYDADSSAANRAELYALEGYSEILLADLFCSGVPLSTLNYKGDFTYHPSSSTAQVYTHAIALLDSALALAGNDAQIRNLAKVGRGRAFLAQGNYTSAVAAVADVPVAFRYTQSMQTCNFAGCFVASASTQPVFDIGSVASVADREGGTGIPYRSSGDPRTSASFVGIVNNNDVWFADKYVQDDASIIVVASGVEAQLIGAEAALATHAGDWLGTLNALRTDGTASGGVYNAGTGGVSGLDPLTDPGTDSARTSLVFSERAKWLFLTGHRQGDLRRMVRSYARPRTTVYPSGNYPGLSGYGSFIDAPIPQSGSYSEAPNPLFHGCLSRD